MTFCADIIRYQHWRYLGCLFLSLMAIASFAHEDPRHPGHSHFPAHTPLMHADPLHPGHEHLPVMATDEEETETTASAEEPEKDAKDETEASEEEDAEVKYVIPVLKGERREIPPSTDGTPGKVMILPLRTDIGTVLPYIFRRGFSEAKSTANLRAIIIDMDTPGGRVDKTEELIDMIRSAHVPVYIYVNNNALSAGAIICLSSDGIYMAPGSKVGAATPIMLGPNGIQEMPDDINEKMRSPVLALARGLAQEKRHLESVAVAFIDRQQEVRIGDTVVNKKGDLLVFTAEEATQVIEPMTEPVFAEAIAKDMDAVIKEIGLEGAEVVRLEVSRAEKLAKYITLIAPFLMMGFIFGLYIEAQTPGIGIPGLIAIICLVIFLFGHFVAGLAGYEDLALIAIGILLLALEIFVIPGFGFAGIFGILFVVTGLMMAMVPWLPSSMPDLPNGVGRISNYTNYFVWAVTYTALTLVAGVVGIIFLSRYAKEGSGPFGAIVLKGSASAATGYTAYNNEEQSSLIGETGVALSDLHPSGVARIGGQRLDVVSRDGYVLKGEAVLVTRVNGPRIEVIKQEPEGSNTEEN